MAERNLFEELKQGFEEISQALQNATKEWDIDAIVQAVIADDPEAKAIQSELSAALAEVKAGNYTKDGKRYRATATNREMRK